MATRDDRAAQPQPHDFPEPLQTYYAAVGRPDGPGWLEVLVKRFGPGRYEQQPTGVTYRSTREMQQAIGAKNRGLHPPPA